MIDPKEAPVGYEAVRYRRPADCEVHCALVGKAKKCRKANCSASTRGDCTEVYFKEI